jgi:predicted RNA-binding protein with PIN domain
MHYIIDGYNLIFRLTRGHERSLQVQRQQIILELTDRVEILGLKITLVFDSMYQKNESRRTYYKNLEIVYTGEGQTADEWILANLHEVKKPNKIQIVTSDKHLAWKARRLGAQTVPVEEFIDWLNQRYFNKILKKNRTEEVIVAPKIEVKQPEEPKPAPLPAPMPKKPEKGSLEYYQTIFEEEYTEILKSTPVKEAKVTKKEKASQTKAKKPAQYQKKATDPALEMERWLEIFEKNAQQTD